MEAVEPRVIHTQNRRIDKETNRVARVVENGAGTYHIACEVLINNRIASTGASHEYVTGEAAMEEAWKGALRWLKSGYPRVMPWHRNPEIPEGMTEVPKEKDKD
jgi:hypothetical protein